MYMLCATVILATMCTVNCKQVAVFVNLKAPPVGCTVTLVTSKMTHSHMQCARMCTGSCREFSYDGEKQDCLFSDGVIEPTSSQSVFRTLVDYTYNSQFDLWYRIGANNTHTWRQSKAICECERGHLFEIRNQEMHDWLISLTVYEGTDYLYYYIDGTDETTWLDWRNRDNNSLWTSTDIQLRNSGGNQHCMTIKYNPGGGSVFMNDYNCDRTNSGRDYRYVCEL